MTSISSKWELDGDTYKTLLESTRAIPWKIHWDSMQFAYIGPQIEELLGWAPDSWKTVQDWADRIHAEDRDWAVNFCVAQSKAGVDHEADYRALKKNGDYVWIRDVVHVVRKDNGEVDSLVGFMFDISERKRTEEQLAALRRELEELSFKDGLTGIANRRRFDSVMETEWQNACRTKQSISMLMLDIDCFKQYNDRYGHLEGDQCLKRVARLLSLAAARSRDFVARFGGEEFILLLPDTNESGAYKIASRCRDLIAGEHIPHEASDVSKYLTVSIGLCTATPECGDEVRGFIELGDKRMYQAKQRGRNTIVSE
ncbi:sensor domain-containing diguanylate cyclase [Dyella acidiphila]|uniref:diguanylate cyclase n=1 Tax=Dyella acidiphila TaxID=2775866 RepID=A0ABR9G6S0_9GAMM|nr:sensor domain-containing diguanylate cyclase [Dyella acidiphila]MBE1159714.1 sensor domain-containing diguanylate cyclase [Dyella acidiphila]